MKILIVCRLHGDHIAAFITEQAEALRALGNEVRFELVEKGNIVYYIRFLHALRRTIADWNPDIIHAHYGICGLVSNLQRNVPVVVTYPGSDINSSKVRPLSILSMRLSKFNLLMNKRQLTKVRPFVNNDNIRIQCYGINLEAFPLQDKMDARKKMGLEQDKEYVLFSSKLTRWVKDPQLAMDAIARLNALRNKRINELKNNVVLLELTGGYSKEEMAALMNAVDVALVTSKTEGSPQFTKEVMACGTPIVSVDVGDVAEQLEGVSGCYVAHSRNPEEISELLLKALEFKGKTNGRERILKAGLDNKQIALKIMDIYNRFLKK